MDADESSAASADGAENSGEGERPDPALSVPGAIDGLSRAEQLLGLGALLILFADFFGDILLDEYAVNPLTWLVAVVAVFAIWARRLGSQAFPVPYGWLLKVVGYGGGLFGARDLVEDIEGGWLEGDLTLVFAFALYAGAALMTIGGRRLSRTDSPDSGSSR